ncbi:hypothetical protein PENARI_c038G09160 [Penicillium arizonense]|uniref:Ornithine aminotransferase n=1 Tax=Penicillium arizonense TaxID=1835702 RepID=A0A1F5L419_PENAI|nr:hypothetical protein PENARI_c038G09160 [Penicillium arizonense]OGE47679.1 hypothetical protein PENARI_c038G09160 [Penicillium arizonense]
MAQTVVESTVSEKHDVSPASPKKSIPALSPQVAELMKKESEYIVGGFTPLPAYITGGQGSMLRSIDGKEYIDFIAMFSAGSLGQCHPKLVEAVTSTAQTSTIVNTSLRVASWPTFAEMMCCRFGYDKINAAVTGSEAADTAVKIARKWGQQVKGISAHKMLVLGVGDNYHGLLSGIWPIMNPDVERDAYGVFDDKLTNVHPVKKTILRYGHIEDMEECLAEHHGNVAAIIMECIHGHLPTFEQDKQYARAVALLCKKYNILFISDEIRMGAGKTGRFLCSEWLGEDIKPDMITIGKSITGGAYPAAFVLGNNETMSLVKPYQCAGTFAQTPMAIACTTTALKIIDEEGLVTRAAKIQDQFLEYTKDWVQKFAFVEFVTARGADFNITLKLDYHNPLVTARRFAALAMHKGLVTYPLEGRIRMSIAMTIPDEALQRGFEILRETAEEIEQYEEIAGGVHETE